MCSVLYGAPALSKVLIHALPATTASQLKLEKKYKLDAIKSVRDVSGACTWAITSQRVRVLTF